MQKITPFLWFDGKAEEAARFYTSIFKKSKMRGLTRYGNTGTGPKGSVMTAVSELDGQEFLALNGGPQFPFTEAVSSVVNCESQDEIDYFWEKLSAGGQEIECGWLRDKVGLSRQIVPTRLSKMLQNPNPEKTNRVMQTVLQMKQLDLKRLEQAYGRSKL